MFRSAAVLMVLVGSVSICNAQSGNPAEKEVIAATYAFSAAADSDPESILSLETDDFTFANDGRIADKKFQAGVLKQAKARGEKQRSNVRIEKVQAAGPDTFIVVGTDSVAETVNGKEQTEVYAFTHVMRREGGRWLVQHSHSSTRRPPAPPAK